MSHWAPGSYSRRSPPWGRVWKPAWGNKPLSPPVGRTETCLGTGRRAWGENSEEVCASRARGWGCSQSLREPPVPGGTRPGREGGEGMKEGKWRGRPLWRGAVT